MDALRLRPASSLTARRVAQPCRASRIPLSARAASVRPELVSLQGVPRRPAPNAGGLSELMYKLQLCIKIFFPDKPKEVTPKEEVKRRLKMVLVADRCGMDPSSLGELKKTIAKALQDFVDIESEESIEVNINDDPGLGTVYCVAIPVRRVKAETRFSDDGRPIQLPNGNELLRDGVLLEWDPMDYNSDPSSRFPMGC